MWIRSKLLRAQLGAGLVGMMACQYTSPGGGDDVTPDAGGCLAVNRSCRGDVLSICAGPGADVQSVTCSWGCDSTSDPHCKRIAPTGGGATIDDLDPASFAGIAETFSLAGTIDGGLGTLGGQDATTAQVGYALQNGIAVFRFHQLQIGALRLTGSQPIVLAADGDILIDAPIDATGQCATSPEIAGAGGGNGGQTTGADGSLDGGGNGGANVSGGTGGGGGGGWGAAGGLSGGGEFGGGSFGDPTVMVLRGGGGGGAGRGTAGSSFRGGGGGGALQLVSNTKIEFRNSGSINAGGCGGRRGAGATDEGGGGGAGGTIVLEAPVVIVGANSVLAVNGGSGGGGNSNGVAHDGFPGALSRVAAIGGTGGGAGGGAGGAGGAGGTIDGQPAASGASVVFPGGGGGAVGWIRINTRSGTATIDGTLSPNFTDPSTTATQGTAVTQ